MKNEAFTSAILGMSDTLYRVAATQLRQRADQEDAVQEALRRAWERSGEPAGELAARILASSEADGSDDATVAVVRLSHAALPV